MQKRIEKLQIGYVKVDKREVGTHERISQTRYYKPHDRFLLRDTLAISEMALSESEMNSHPDKDGRVVSFVCIGGIYSRLQNFDHRLKSNNLFTLIINKTIGIGFGAFYLQSFRVSIE